MIPIELETMNDIVGKQTDVTSKAFEDIAFTVSRKQCLFTNDIFVRY
ncbi:hypothetical protein ACFX5U_08470 [Sphingobacterium sp. SG20118]